MSKYLSKEKNMSQTKTDNRTKKTVFAGIFAAITYVVFTYLSIPIPTPTGQISVHLGNTFVCLGALILGSIYGSIGGAIGLTIGDLLTPAYIAESPITFIIKFIMGFITGYLAHNIFHISTKKNSSKVLYAVIISSFAGLLFNAIFDPILRYFYKIFILGKSLANVSLSINFVVTILNSIISLIICTILYMALRTPLKKAGIIKND